MQPNRCSFYRWHLLPCQWPVPEFQLQLLGGVAATPVEGGATGWQLRVRACSGLPSPDIRPLFEIRCASHLVRK
jgi:hypothetical protein